MAARGATSGVAAETTIVALQCEECVFHPGVADLFKALVIIGAAAHPIKILRNDRMIGTIRQCKPIDWLVAIVTGSSCHRETNLGPGAAQLIHIGQLSNNNVGP